jgi:uncharacterized protein (TIGR02246 family)
MRSPPLLLALAALGATVACGPSGPTPEDEAAAMAGIERHNVAVEQALSAGDLDALMAEIAEDAVWLPPGEEPIEGKEAIRAFYEDLFSQVRLEGRLSPEHLEVHVMGDWAVLRGVLVGSVTPLGGGEPASLANKFVNVLRREPDGSWKHVWDIWNPMPQEAR